MADTKITALTALTAADPINDVIPIVDVSDTSMAASGTTKKISVNNILSSSPTASGALTVTGLVTAGSAAITGDLTVDTSTLKVDSTNNRVGIGTATPATALQVVGEIRSSADISNSSDTIIYSFSGGTAGSVRAGLQLIGSTPEIRVYLSSATALTINSTSNLVLKGGTAAANGVGVTFPITPVASSDAKCLDDYEEGTWTATLYGTVTSPATLLTGAGTYTKIGRQVTVYAAINGNTTGYAGAIQVNGLPFNNSAAEKYGVASLGNADWTGRTSANCYLPASQTSVYFIASSTLLSPVYIAHSAGAGREVVLQAAYIV